MFLCQRRGKEQREVLLLVQIYLKTIRKVSIFPRKVSNLHRICEPQVNKLKNRSAETEKREIQKIKLILSSRASKKLTHKERIRNSLAVLISFSIRARWLRLQTMHLDKPRWVSVVSRVSAERSDSDDVNKAAIGTQTVATCGYKQHTSIC